MANIQFITFGKLKGSSIVKFAARHNLREIIAELVDDGHIDPTLTPLNRVLYGPPDADAVAATATALMAEANVKKLRRDAVRAIEIVITLPEGSGVDEAVFFQQSLEWVMEYFEVPVLSCVIHNDEATPHCHILILPLVGGHMVGSALVGRYRRVHDSFHHQVGKRHGLVRQTHHRFSAAVTRQLMDSVFSLLEANSGLTSRVLRALLEPHARNLPPLLSALGLAIPTPKAKGSFAATMTKPQRKK
jgi:hypothetical protein